MHTTPCPVLLLVSLPSSVPMVTNHRFFPALEGEVSVPSSQALIRCCCRIWSAACQILLQSSARSKRAADRRRVAAPPYRPRQKVWLSAKDLPLRVESHKLVPHFVGPFPVSKVVNPTAVRLKLPRSLRVHPTFYASIWTLVFFAC